MAVNKKGIMPEALMRIIIMVVLLFIVFKVGAKVAKSFSGSNAPKFLDDFVNEVNSVTVGNPESEFLVMDPGMAVIGFAKTTSLFRCLGCYQLESKENFVSKTFIRQKPEVEECRNKACACLCMKGYKDIPITVSESRLECDKFYCKTIEGDLNPRISLEDSLKKQGKQLSSYPVWENGFLFHRSSPTQKPLVGISVSHDESKAEACIQKEKKGEESIITIYPGQCA